MVNRLESSAGGEDVWEERVRKKIQKNTESTGEPVRWQVEAVSRGGCSFSCQVFVINETASAVSVTLETNKHMAYILCASTCSSYTPLLCRNRRKVHSSCPDAHKHTLLLLLHQSTRWCRRETPAFINNWWLQEPKANFDWRASMSTHAHTHTGSTQMPRSVSSQSTRGLHRKQSDKHTHTDTHGNAQTHIVLMIALPFISPQS